MIRPQQIKLEDTNVALIGSELDKQQRINAAKTEKEWEGAGQKVGVEIWQCINFGITKWHQMDTFYENDSYIVLHTYKDTGNDSLKWDIHFWLGSNTSIDERGVAAYKTVELDDLLSDIPVQYREVQGHESDKFLALFKKLHVLRGGSHSAFHHVTAEKYEPRLLQVKAVGHTMKATEIPRKASEMNHGDCFVLDTGLAIYVLKGDQASHMELYKAAEVAKGIEDDREGRAHVINLNENETASSEFWKFVEGSPNDIKSAEAHQEILNSKKIPHQDPAMYKLSDDSGSLVLTKSQEAPKLDFGHLQNNEVFIVDCGASIFVWVGAQASAAEKKSCMRYAEAFAAHLNKSHAQISRVVQGGESPEFLKVFGK